MNQIEKEVNGVVVKRKRPSVVNRAVKVAGSIGLVAEYLISGGISDVPYMSAEKLNTGPPRELSPGGEVVFRRDQTKLLFEPSFFNKLQQNESSSTPKNTSQSSLSDSSLYVAESSDDGHDPIIDYAKIDALVAKMEKRPDLFSKSFISGIKIYYPIFEAVGAKYDVPPLLIGIIAYHESHMGQSKNAYNGNSAPFYGFGQRNTGIWTEKDVNDATVGLEELKNYPQRHPDDWRESAFIGWFLYSHRYRYVHEGISKIKALIMSLWRYNNPASGNQRYYEYLAYEKALRSP